VLTETTGDVLAFLPGLREIRQAADELERDAREQGFEVLPLHGDLPPEQQDRALQKLGHRKVVLATNVAETSVTVDGVTAVVDSGLARQMEFEPGVGHGSTQAGSDFASVGGSAGWSCGANATRCVRAVVDEPSHRGRPEQTIPEIRRVDLCGAVLQLFALGESNVERFPWLDAPRPESLAESLRLLHNSASCRTVR